MAERHRRSVGRKIRALREARDWTQRELADRIPDEHVDSQYVSNWERGIHLPEKHLDALAKALEVEPGDVMAGLRAGDRGESPLDLLGPADAAQLDRIEQKLDWLIDAEQANRARSGRASGAAARAAEKAARRSPPAPLERRDRASG